MNRRRTDILDVSEPTLDVGETIRRRDDRLPNFSRIKYKSILGT